MSRKVFLVGDGAVGSTFANDLLQNTIVDELAILEGNAIYSNNHNSVEMSIRVKGNKGRGKMDISAKKIENEWKYTKINIRIKEPKEVIEILENTIVEK